MAFSTARDAGRYLLALLQGGALGGARVASAAAVGALWTPQARIDDGVAYGLGWQVRELEGLRLVEHGGNVAWGGSMFLLVPDRGVAVGVLANLAGPEKEAVAEDVLRLVLGGEPAAGRRPDWRTTTSSPTPRCWTPTPASTRRRRGWCGSPAGATGCWARARAWSWSSSP